MASIIVFVLDDLDEAPAILDAWEAAGVPGITMVESIGIGRLRNALRDDLPLIPSLADLFEREELRHRTLFTVIEDDAVIQRVIKATEEVIGDFTRHHTGLLFVLPVLQVYGLEKRGKP